MRNRGSRAGWALATSALVSAAAAEAAESITYGYDSLGRLVRVERSGSVNDQVIAYYVYDSADNRTNVTVSTPAQPLPPPPLPAPAPTPVPPPSPAIPPPAPPPAVFSVSGGSADEGSDLLFTIERSGTGNQGLSVGYATSNGSAAAGSDYHPVSGTASFVPGQTSVTVAVAILADDSAEPAESLTLALSAPGGGAVLAPSAAQATGTINPSSGPTPPSPPVPPTVEELKAPVGPDGLSPVPAADPGAPADPAGPGGEG
jgi:hypothetical protein